MPSNSATTTSPHTNNGLHHAATNNKAITTKQNVESYGYLGRMKQIVVLVDPYSSGCLVGQEVSKRGYLLIRVWSVGICDIMKGHQPVSCKDLRYYDTITVDELIAQQNAEQAGGKDGSTTMLSPLELAAAAIKESADDLQIVSVIAGGDRGVDFADALSEYFGLLTNGTSIPNRRDKKIQQELCRHAGMRACRQAGGDKFEDIEKFLLTESYPLVVKPLESSGSDGVKLCQTFAEAKTHFEVIMQTCMVDGGKNTGAVAQEFLRGKEYIVDMVSCDGVHKCFMVFVYDKRPANGAMFVYYGCIPVDSESPEAKLLIPYVKGVLDAIGVKYGASHTEVIITADGPCLVEVNCRCNGGDGIWRPLTRALTGGYTQIEACADAYLDKERFFQYPDTPPSPMLASGCEIELVSYRRGTVTSMPGYTMIRHLPSFVQLESIIKPGYQVEYTIDLDTCVGTVCLMHPDAEVVAKDIAFIRYMEDIHGLFEFAPIIENLKRPRGEIVAQQSVVTPSHRAGGGGGGANSKKQAHRRVFSSLGQEGLVRQFSTRRPQLLMQLQDEANNNDKSKNVVVFVDPYSTATVVAKQVMNRGYHVLALWTKGFPEGMREHVPVSYTNDDDDGCKLEYPFELDEECTLQDTIDMIRNVTQGLNLVAIIAGDDLGVDLADALSEALQLRTNGTAIRMTDKKIQQELVAKAGLRAIRQAGGSDFSDVALFLKKESYPIVLKPARTAGSDGVKLCHTFEDAKDFFGELKDSQVFAALEVPSIVAQEYLVGQEFVVDHVSLDGVHKTLMVWSMDKRIANGSSNVYFGCTPEPSDSPDSEILIPYVRAVLDALGVKNGPTHAEVIMTATGPCVIKVSCTARGGDGNWRPLCRALTGGYSQIEATVDAYLDEQAFAALPGVPPSPFKAAGLELMLVSFSRGTVAATPGFDIIKQLPSFVYLETGVQEGSQVDYTIDLFTSVGSVLLMHYDRTVLEEDVARIREMEENNTLFEYDLESAAFTLT